MDELKKRIKGLFSKLSKSNLYIICENTNLYERMKPIPKEMCGHSYIRIDGYNIKYMLIKTLQKNKGDINIKAFLIKIIVDK